MFRPLVGAAAIALAASTASAQYPGYYPPPHHPHPVPVPVPAYYPPPVRVVIPPPPVVVAAPVYVPAPAPLPTYTLGDFVKCFRPTDGHHRILVVNPHTGRPVEVCFDLPCARLREVEVCGHAIEFHYVGARNVKIVFHHDGTARVFGN